MHQPTLWAWLLFILLPALYHVAVAIATYPR